MKLTKCDICDISGTMIEVSCGFGAQDANAEIIDLCVACAAEANIWKPNRDYPRDYSMLRDIIVSALRVAHFAAGERRRRK